MSSSCDVSGGPAGGPAPDPSLTPPDQPGPRPTGHRILITGFEPFDGADRNPSWDLAEELHRRAQKDGLIVQAQLRDTGDELQLHTLRLPVEFETAGTLLTAQLEGLAAAGQRPDLVVALGLAGGTAEVRLERVGLNLRDARIPDNAGAQPLDEPVRADGPGALFSTLRLKAAHARIVDAGIPVALSLSAGTFVCNDVLYMLLDHLRHTRRTGQRDVPAGFVHVPDLHAPDGAVTLEQAAQAVDLLLVESLRTGPDAPTATGTLH